ncbi:OmpA family protein [Chordicoccus furentiruminis]|uniref:OmpA family protein n=1 Tax=Chordicoccus furentiruminis TaxID=2709410 RepID=UPI0023A7952B|nr:OmpA family protein [Chordicoccus furentiruminis]
MAGRRKRRRDDEPSYWLSYSDMMAGLLLMFVIIISFTMMQAKTKFEADEKELKAQQETLARQQAQLEDQNTTMSEQSTTLTEQESQLAAQKAALEKQREELAAQQKKLKEQQDQLAAAQATMDSQESALSDAETTLTQQSSELTEKEKELAEAQAALKKQQTTLENQQKKLAGAESKISSQQQQMEDLVGVRKELIEQLKKAFEGTANVTVDSDGSIVFESSVLFDFNDAKLSDDGKTFLKQFLPQYFSILLSDQFKDYVSEIIIEGHTDTDGGYLFNLELSQERALAVATYCLTDDGSVLPAQQVEALRTLVAANGKSYSDPILNQDGSVNMDASRRVEFKFRLKDEEMVNQMLDILNGGQTDSQ